MKNKEQYIFPFLERLLDGAEVEWKKLGEVCEIKGRIGFRGYTRNDLVEKGEGAITLSPSNIINQQLSFENCSYISWVKYEESPEIKVELNDVIFTKTASVGKTALVKTLPQEATINPQLVLLKRIKCIPDYLAYILQNDYFQQSVKQLTGQGSVPNVPQSSLAKILIPIPPLSVQRKLVEILDKFTELEAELEAELDCRKRQYEYYRNKLLTFDMLNTPPEKLNSINWLTIKDISKNISSGGTPRSNNATYYGGDIPWLRTQEVNFSDIWDTEVKITKEGMDASSAKYIPANCVIIAMYGATVGRVGINKIPLTTNQACANIEVDENIALYRYVFHYLSSQYEYIRSLGAGSQTNINARIVKGLKIPIPPLSEQQRIVSILDKFDTLTSSISEGLPKEIELRRKQYEYYREQLLSFRH